MKLNELKSLKSFFILWLTQSLSTLGSAMTGFALVIVLYRNSGSALATAMLSVCSYAPYVLMSIFAGALSDRWNKKATMLVCDTLAAVSTLAVLILFKTGSLEPWHLYIINALGGLMNTVQQPASEVATTLLTPEKYYQKTSGMRSFSGSLVTILTPSIATAVMSFWGLEAVIAIDLVTFGTAFLALLLFIKIPEIPKDKDGGKQESVLASAKSGLVWLKIHRKILWLILFLAAINLIASIYDAALPAMMLSHPNGGETALGAVNTCVGLASLAGSIIVTFLPEPKNRLRVICNTLLISMSTENFLLAFGKTPLIWCIGAVLGWIVIPIMNANMDVIFRSEIPAEMQGRVFSARNTLQFFTIPVGFFLGGILVDKVFEPLIAGLSSDSLPVTVFGGEKGSGAAMLFFVIGIAGVAVCLIFRRIILRIANSAERSAG
ncbi:MAG: MFS transporter [Oscillospiraceae bacterium]|nr:MFS transporter [Oscillospiraceae bacterium]